MDGTQSLKTIALGSLILNHAIFTLGIIPKVKVSQPLMSISPERNRHSDFLKNPDKVIDGMPKIEITAEKVIEKFKRGVDSKDT